MVRVIEGDCEDRAEMGGGGERERERNSKTHAADLDDEGRGHKPRKAGASRI